MGRLLKPLHSTGSLQLIPRTGLLGKSKFQEDCTGEREQGQQCPSLQERGEWGRDPTPKCQSRHLMTHPRDSKTLYEQRAWTKILIFSPSVKRKLIFNGWNSLEDEKYPKNLNLFIAVFIDVPAAGKGMQERSMHLHAMSRLWMSHVISYFIHPYWAHVSCKGFWLIVVLTRMASCAALWENKLRSVSQTVSLENGSILLIPKADIKKR